ncbi:MAG: UDP-3-O-(3-hydroxymyristoyl)glucosamine N-acyltransferase [Proteobacteria bacterium]|nr:UDP-3-O-(3-hydroxymyristoyl)glucosamine N-acyltransferase [Pseudomonadota bacterium]MBU1738606.1 UDP-3-O-(3-hydroxymyristoyl)glucosamine N-acyltransferase [Pseudomonadota bacterium]
MGKTATHISELAAMVDGEWAGSTDVVLTGLADIGSATAGQISFLVDKNKAAGEINASALIVPRAFGHCEIPVIYVDDPVLAAAIIHRHFIGDEFVAAGISDRAFVGTECSIAAEVTISPMVVIGNNVRIGSRVTIGPGTVVGDSVSIGDGTFLHPNVTVLAGSLIGERVIIHSGTVIGSDGFGYAHDRHGNHVKRPHVGFVQIDDDVEIGANVCVDRATFGKTWIRRGTKIDNLVQIAHNVEIGENSILVSQVGISGSSRLGYGVVMGGKAALSGHLEIGNRVTIAAKSGVTSDLEDGAIVSGFPAIPHRKWLRASTSFHKLPDLIKDVREIKKKLAALFADGSED